ncbi:MAG: cysteate synthase [Bacteroidales bacterium]|nr:cysteate synthase [Bacteroidales bacterium]
MEVFKPTEYHIESKITGKTYRDTGWMLDEPGQEKPALLQTVYHEKQLVLKESEQGLFIFSDWLPAKRFLQGSSAPVTYKSEKLASHLGLENLFITFSGYWPEKGAFMRTCSFKETEAYSVCSRLEAANGQVLVVASAGNTARSFARVCSDNNIPLLLCMPEDNIGVMWFDEPLNDCVQLVVTPEGSDYSDAIHLSNLACKVKGFIAEGGAKNIARRDGMATTVLSAATTIGAIPEYYFQAIGSGTGAIAAWEANLRLIRDGRFGNHKMKLMVSQNSPFHPIYDAWKAGSRALLPFDDDMARKQIELIHAKVLSNRKPPYSLTGGLFDALTDAGGDVLLATNKEAEQASQLFEETEGIDIHPAAAVATASLISAVNDKRMDKKACIMLNITGGGEKRFKHDKNKMYWLLPSEVFDIAPGMNEVEEKLKGLFDGNQPL